MTVNWAIVILISLTCAAFFIWGYASGWRASRRAVDPYIRMLRGNK